MMSGNLGNSGMGNNFAGYNSQMMPFPPQMMKPANQSELPTHSELGFQMNPISSKQRKKW